MTTETEAIQSAAIDLLLAFAEVSIYFTDDIKAASAIVGNVDPDTYRMYAGQPTPNPLRTAASQSRFVGLTRRMAHYVNEGVWADSHMDLLDALTDFRIGIELLNGKDGPCLIDCNETSLISENSSSILRQLHTAATARSAIDQGESITVPMLAALAGVSEKTVRMAANPNNERPLITTKDGAATLIKADAALEWLNRRGDFKPTRYFASEGSRPQLTSFWALAAHLLAVREERGLSIEEMAKALTWSTDTRNAYAQLERSQPPKDLAAFQPRHLEQLMRHLDIVEPVELARATYPLIATAYGEALAKEQLT